MKKLNPEEQRHVAGGTGEPKGYLVRKRRDGGSYLDASFTSIDTVQGPTLPPMPVMAR